MTSVNWKNLNPVITYANELECAPSFTFGPRIIYAHQFIFVVKGKGTAYIQKRTYEAQPGDLFYYGPHVVHQFIADEHDPFIVYGIHFSFNGSLPEKVEVKPVLVTNVPENYSPLNRSNQRLEKKAGQLDVPEYCHPGTTWAKELLYQITQNYTGADLLSPLLNRSLFTQFLIQLQRWTNQPNLHIPEQIKIVTRVKALLELHAEFPYSRGWLQQWTLYNEDHVARMFRKQFGISPHNYHLTQKIQLAKQMLAHTDLTINEISEKLYIGTVQYFSRQFKANTGHSPTAYRSLRRMI